MATKPRKTKPREQKIVEEFFPVDQDDLKYTIEKKVKAPLTENITRGAISSKVTEQETALLKTGKTKKTYKKTPALKSKKNSSRSKKTSTKKQEPWKPTKITLKKPDEGYELIITEKPQAALKIASALGKSTQRNINKIPYYEVNRDGKEIVVGCAVGHLFTLKQNTPGYSVPTFDISWTPNYLARKKDFTKRYYEAMLKLAKGAGSLTVATDFDIEGEVIGLNIVRLIANQKDANRMKFSTLTNTELNKAYEEKSKTLNWGQAIAGETRHYLDWFYGINLSRALMNAIKTTGKFKIMSIGRVQGPALNLIVKKEREILNFKSVPYWQTFITIKDPKTKNTLELQHPKDLFEKSELKKFENLKGKPCVAETKKSSQRLPPQPPFNLTTLQTEAYKFHGITPSRTLQIAQSLYLAGLISYPRTSSQQLPASIGYKEILNKLAKEFKVEHLIKNKTPVEGKKTDPAHPSIYPTGQTQILSDEDEKVYNLISKRFLSLFCEDAIVDNKKVTATVKLDDETSDLDKGGAEGSGSKIGGALTTENTLNFTIRGSAISKKAWMEIYPSKLKEIEVPDIDGEVEIIDSRTEQKETQPPKRFSPASILTQLEKKNLGTKATRSSILETLYDRGYIEGKSIQATPIGMSLIATLERYSPIIIDEKLTRNFEQKMDSIVEAKKDFEEKEKKVIEEAKKTITDIAKDFEEKEKKIGKELVEANAEFREQQKRENTLLQCPKCKKGNLAITYSKKTRRSFVACDAYPDCKNTFSLPPNGIIKRTNKTCEECGFPKLMRLSKSRRPWEFCFNPECPINKERIEEYNKKKQAEES